MQPKPKTQKPKDDLGRTIDLDELIKAYAVEADTFDVMLPHGETLTFKPITRPSMLKGMYAAAALTWETLQQAGGSKSEVHPWRGFIPESQDEFFSAYKISELSVEPKIELLHALKLLRNAFLIEYLEAAIDANSKTMSSLRFIQRVEETKKNLTDTLLKRSDSESAPKSSDDTPTN